MIPRHFEPLAGGHSGRKIVEASAQFVTSLWCYPKDAYTFIGIKRGNRWRDIPIKGNREAAVHDIFENYPAARNDLYFCTSAFSGPRRLAACALPSRYGVCDVDAADPSGYDPRWNILWETSPGRFQAVWIWSAASDGSLAELFSKAIVVKDGGDRGGWSITKMLRVPGSVNHKPIYRRPFVTLRAYDDRPQHVPASLAALARKHPVARPIVAAPSSGADAAAIMRLYRRDMNLMARTLMTATTVLYPDRSAAVFQIVAGMTEAGAPAPDIETVLLANPHFFQKWGHNPVRAAEEVMRIQARIGGAR